MHHRLSIRPPVPSAASLRPAPAWLPFPFSDPDRTTLVPSQAAFGLAAAALGLDPGSRVLVPAYHEIHQVEALLAARLECAFYDVSLAGERPFEPDEAQLDSLVSAADALLLVHYLGFPQDVARWRQYCVERRLLLIEDCSMGWPAMDGNAPLGTASDVAVVGFGVSLGLDVSAISVALRGGRSPDVGMPAIASKDVRVLKRLADPAIAARRQVRYEELLEHLRDRVAPGFERLPPGSAPALFPLVTDDAARECKRLRSAGVEAVALWPQAHPGLPEAACPVSDLLRGQLLGLPVHQELRPADTARIATAVTGKAARRPPVEMDLIDDLHGLRSDWDALALASRNVFASWEWVAAWLEHVAPGGRTTVARCRCAGRTVALIPLHVSRYGPIRLARFAGHGPADQLGPVCAPSDRHIAAAGLQSALSALRSYDVFLGEHMLAAEGWSALSAGQPVRRTSLPVLLCAGGWDAFLATLGRHARERIRAGERKLARSHDVRYRLADDPGRLGKDLASLRALHLARFPGGTEFSRLWAFHEAFARQAFERGRLRLWFVELDGEPVAASYGFRFGGVESGYQLGRLPGVERLGVGQVMLTQVLRAALEDGVEEIRLGRGGMDYKYRFATSDTGLETVALARGAVGQAAVRSLPAVAWWRSRRSAGRGRQDVRAENGAGVAGPAES